MRKEVHGTSHVCVRARNLTLLDNETFFLFAFEVENVKNIINSQRKIHTRMYHAGLISNDYSTFFL